MISLAPSRAHRWINCPNSVYLEADAPKLPPSKYALDGIEAHGKAAAILSGKSSIENEPDNKMTNAVSKYVNRVLTLANGNKLSVEYLISLIYREKINLKGILDCFFYDEKNKTAYILDFKYSYREQVAFKNWQLLSYAYLLGSKYTPDYYHLELISPLGLSTWIASAIEMKDYYFQTLLNTMHSIYINDNLPTKSGEWCKYCAALATCPAIKSDIESAIVKEKEPSDIQIDDSKLGEELALLTRLKNSIDLRYEALYELVLSRIIGGVPINNWGVSNGRSSLKWDDTKTEDIEKLGKLFNIDLQKPREFITPTQSRDRGIPMSVLESYTIKNPGKLKLIRT